jgi:outer membrane beta-barrel protein
VRNHFLYLGHQLGCGHGARAAESCGRLDCQHRNGRAAEDSGRSEGAQIRSNASAPTGVEPPDGESAGERRRHRRGSWPSRPRSSSVVDVVDSLDEGLLLRRMMRTRLRLVRRAAYVGALVAASIAPDARAQCVDDELRQELVGGRHYRGVQDRLFTKAFRHELSAMGGVYAADLYSSSWLGGGAYTFHFSEDLGLEASVAFTRFRSAVTDSYERRYPDIEVLERPDRPGRLYFGHLVWTLAYGKLRWMGGGISRFDFNVAVGAGVTDDSTSRGVTGSAGLGAKLFVGSWFAFRIDARDHVLDESLVGDQHLVNDVVVTLGGSVFVPFGG